MVVSYRLSIVTVALSVTIRSQFVSDAQINRGWVTLGPNLGVLSLEYIRHVVVAKSEHPRLTKGEINFEEFQHNDHNPPTSQTDRRTDRQTTCDRNTALCTKVHRAVKTGIMSFSAGCNLVITAATQYALHIISCKIVHSY